MIIFLNIRTPKIDDLPLTIQAKENHRIKSHIKKLK